MNNQQGLLKRLAGFDATSEVFMDKDKVLRGVYPEYSRLYREILHICEIHDLFQQGIITTREIPMNSYLTPKYDLVLEHERIPFISYPHEWAAGMLKDAALFHIELFETLSQYGLTIKDFHPYNILYNNTEPVFVDFTSIIPLENLKNENYLKPLHLGLIFRLFRLLGGVNALFFYQMHQGMFLPYILLPLYLMQQRRYEYVRKRMRETTPNARRARVIIPTEMMKYAVPRPWRWKTDIGLYLTKAFMKNFALLGRENSKKIYWQFLKKETNSLNSSITTSARSYYYIEKNQDYEYEPTPSWNDKNRGVFESIKNLKPETLLDLGCNTGWFSILASKSGCKVVAIDNDEACIEVLYLKAKHEHLNILPLVMDFTNTVRDSGDIFTIAAADRLKCDMVLALALIHHLTLGQGLNFTNSIQLLNSFAKKHLVLEFVPLNDERIVSEPNFFKAFHSNPDEFTWYTQDNLVNELRQFYTTVEIKESFPKPRSLLICSR